MELRRGVTTLVAQDVSFAYGDRPVLREVTLPPVRAGEVVALVGPNATGKSTLLKCLAGLETARGTVRVEGPAGPDGSAGRALADHVLYVPQDLPPASSLTVIEAVLLARRRSRVEEAERTLVELGIDDLALTPLSQLSGGQRQLVSLAQAVLRRPSVLLLDEPTSTLDLRNQLRILDAIRDLAVTGPTAVVVTVHDLNLVGRVADRVVVLRSGAVQAAGVPREVITESLVREVYGVDAVISHTDDGGLTVAATRTV